MVENVGFEPRLLNPNQVCYHYTTFSILVERGIFQVRLSPLPHIGGQEGIRTLTPFLAREPKSRLSANSITCPCPLVEHIGLEPITSCVQSRRSPSCANAPKEMETSSVERFANPASMVVCFSLWPLPKPHWNSGICLLPHFLLKAHVHLALVPVNVIQVYITHHLTIENNNLRTRAQL